jgi:molecular chaperone GrpE
MVKRSKKKREPDPEGTAEATPEANSEASPEERIAALEKECEELRDKSLRAQADYQNLRRRGQLDYESGLQRSLQPLFEELLLVLDYLDMALATTTTGEEARNLALGVEMTRNKFMAILEQSGVKAIAHEGLFDPSLHEAADTRDEEGVEPGTIVETVRRGYTWRDSVLRYAKVIVAAGGEPEEPEADTETEPGSEATPEATPEAGSIPAQEEEV